MLEELSHIDLESITDPYAKSLLILCLNVIENQQLQLKSLQELVQSLRDELNKLKGEQGKPVFKPQKENQDISSHNQIPKNKPHIKTQKKPFIPIDKEIICQVDREILPADAIFKGYDTVIQQDIVFRRENTKFNVEIWYWNASFFF